MEKIWLKSYPSGVPAEIDIDHIPSLVALFERACKTFADKVAYISMGREITYRQLDAEASEFAGWLQAKGMQKAVCVLQVRSSTKQPNTESTRKIS